MQTKLRVDKPAKNVQPSALPNSAQQRLSFDMALDKPEKVPGARNTASANQPLRQARKRAAPQNSPADGNLKKFFRIPGKTNAGSRWQRTRSELAEDKIEMAEDNVDMAEDKIENASSAISSGQQ